VSLVIALEERARAAPVRRAEPQQYIVVSVEDNRKRFPRHTGNLPPDDVLLCYCRVYKLRIDLLEASTASVTVTHPFPLTTPAEVHPSKDIPVIRSGPIRGVLYDGGNGSCGECAHSAAKGKVSKFFESSYNQAMVDGKNMHSAIVYHRAG